MPAEPSVAGFVQAFPLCTLPRSHRRDLNQVAGIFALSIYRQHIEAGHFGIRPYSLCFPNGSSQPSQDKTQGSGGGTDEGGGR